MPTPQKEQILQDTSERIRDARGLDRKSVV